jgi:hypothetical protein
VYRGGYRWTVRALHIADALRRACLQTDAMSGQQFVDAGTRREPCQTPAPNGLPIALRCFTHKIEAVYCDGSIVHVVDVSDTITHALALDVLARARESFAAVQAYAFASTVRDTDGSPVAVRFYKTGAKGLSVRAKLGLHIKMLCGDQIVWRDAINLTRLLAELESEGLLKWPRKTSAAEKARVLDGVVHNAALDEYIAAMQATLVDATQEVCERLVPPPKRVDEMTEAELRERKAQHEAELAKLSPSATARHEITTKLVAVQRRLDVFDSIREHGFVVGEVVDVLPAPWDDEQITRRARVVEVVVEHKPTYFGNQPDTQHCRVVEFFDGSKNIRPETYRLRKV